MQIPVVSTHGWGENRNMLLAIAAPLIQHNGTALIVVFFYSSNNHSPLTFFSIPWNRGRRVRGGAGGGAIDGDGGAIAAGGGVIAAVGFGAAVGARVGRGKTEIEVKFLT